MIDVLNSIREESLVENCFLYFCQGVFEKLIDGGHQENNKRAGTENVAQIVGLGKACEIARENLDSHITNMKESRNYFINQIEQNIKDIKINGDKEKRLPGNANILFKGIKGLK